MKMEDQSMSPKDDTLSQAQDPLERRRLQNRLSQRNHRRKIRERIAKLQDRVIANELSAAAALNGWDQVYNPSLFPRSHSSYSENDPVFTSRDVSPLVPDQCTLFIPPYPTFSQSWRNDFNTFPPQAYLSDLSQFTGASEASPISPITSAPVQPNHGMSSPSSGIGGETYRENIGIPETLVSDSLSTAAPNQPLYYFATEQALPQIIQAINTMSSQYKVIVLVPPESPASASMALFPSPTSPYDSGHTGPNNGPAALQSSSQSLSCLCYPQNIPAGPPAYTAPKSCMRGGSYLQACPFHKMVNSMSPGEAFSVRMM